MMKQTLLGVTLLAATLVPLSAYASSNNVPSTKGTALKVETAASASAVLKPGTVAENSIGFVGSLPPSDILTQMIDQMKKGAAKTGKDTAVVIHHDASGKEDKLTISLKDSTENIVAKIQEKFKDAMYSSAEAIPAEQVKGKSDSVVKGEMTVTASAALKPGTAAENVIGFAGGLPPSDILTQMIDQMKKDVAKTGKDTAVVIYHAGEGKEDKLTISLKDSTEALVAKIQEKFKDAKPISASATAVSKK